MRLQPNDSNIIFVWPIHPKNLPSSRFMIFKIILPHLLTISFWKRFNLMSTQTRIASVLAQFWKTIYKKLKIVLFRSYLQIFPETFFPDYSTIFASQEYPFLFWTFKDILVCRKIDWFTRFSLVEIFHTFVHHRQSILQLIYGKNKKNQVQHSPYTVQFFQRTISFQFAFHSSPHRLGR